MNSNATPPTASPPVVSLLTPPGRGAVAILGVQGTGAVQILGNFFRPRFHRQQNLPTNRPLYGEWHSGDGYIEDLVVWLRSQSSVQIHCHGGQVAWKKIVRDLSSRGCRQVESHELVRADSKDAVTAAARLQLPGAKTAKAAAILLDQAQGSLALALEQILARLRQQAVEPASQQLDHILQYSDLGLHLNRPWRIALVGPPNVGKSSLVNALLGFERSIVFAQPGTTRDVLSEHSALAGWPVEFFDTVGLRTTGRSIEQAGIDQTNQMLPTVDLKIWIHELNDLKQRKVPTQNEIVVCNKIDLLNKQQITRLPDSVLRTSALTGQGIDELMQTIVRQLVPSEPGPQTPVPFTQRQIDLLQRCREAIGDRRIEKAIALLESLLEKNGEEKKQR